MSEFLGVSVFALPPGALGASRGLWGSGPRRCSSSRDPASSPAVFCCPASPFLSSYLRPGLLLSHGKRAFFVSYFKSILKCGKGKKKPRGGSVTASRLDVLGSSRFSESFRSPGLHAVSGTRFVCGVLEFVRLRDHLLVFLECVMDTCLMSVS